MSEELIARLRNRDAVVMSGLYHCIPTMREAADEIERLRALLSCPLIKNVRREALEEAAKVADEAQATAREEIAEEKAEEGYDPYAFGSGFLGGELTAAVNIAKAIRALKETKP